MSQSVFLAVLFAALLHAAWNAFVKQDNARFLAISMMGAAQGAISLAIIPFTTFPGAASWGWIFLSASLHTGYKLSLIRAYQTGELGQVYPLARGSAPLLTAIAGYVLLGETLTPLVTAGVILLSLGILLMSVKGGGALGALDRRAVGFALMTSVFIAGYTLVDGVGARGAISSASYLAWMFFVDGVVIALVFLARGGPAALGQLSRGWRIGAPAAALSLGSYWIVVWAMTRAPLGAVAALRESSILFALLISAFILKERVLAWRIAAAVVILAGVAAMRAG